ncbi:hypothetical protein HA466_0107490 [Hirschfeldia incana]|nr:hypothetical protein HA466_0107490 [Hirschfeldia incana]
MQEIWVAQMCVVRELRRNKQSLMSYLSHLILQTEEAFLKQPKVFLSSKISGKGKRPGKGGNRFWKNIGLGFKTSREAISGLFGLLCLIGLVNQSFVFMFFFSYNCYIIS